MLSGGIPEGLGMLRNLSVLRVADNSLTGNIPLSLGSSNSLVFVQFTNNSLTGPIPSALAESSLLQAPYHPLWGIILLFAGSCFKCISGWSSSASPATSCTAAGSPAVAAGGGIS
ncbi:hypothetical protein E2562_020532 [Oryza meyeriana var. granulata]|uniref:Leucine-rich repeat-containing N-terminal plant-type domain-containing protein n=1 Tax=Oryza meyeriana var. granulata TaxID=110450 RepID=A0A6G1EBT4_9ORYZ|nr:hypothetical protein E2562_020532 [Oryza meyeriana var. granulata]